ncbi:MAG: ABC transporter permease [Chitinophagales bacterium]|nr:ABC transporter permease [Chitinophagales bacterium]
MIDIDKWKEILLTLSKNKLRTALTMFGVFWGIFMLVIMLGAGNGLQNGVMYEMAGVATNSFWMWGSRTTVPYKGLKPGRFIRFNNDDTKAILENVKELKHFSPCNQLGGYQGTNIVARKNNSGTFNVMGLYPEIRYIESVGIDAGRFLNEKDISDNRKVAIIGQKVRDILFTPDEDPIGDAIKINGVYFKVVGVSNPGKRKGNSADEEREKIFIPISTFQQAFNYGDKVGWYAATAKDGYSASIVEEKIKAILKKRHKVAEEDQNAIGSYNSEENYLETLSIFTGIKSFVGIVGFLTLLAGSIGIANIMLIIVKERTKEIGVRKALGARPSNIIAMVLQESVLLTIISGFFGLVLGIMLLDTVSFAMSGMSDNSDVPFRNPEISSAIAIGALIILIITGIIAGLIPASIAAKIKPVSALSAE